VLLRFHLEEGGLESVSLKSLRLAALVVVLIYSLVEVEGSVLRSNQLARRHLAGVNGLQHHLVGLGLQVRLLSASRLVLCDVIRRLPGFQGSLLGESAPLAYLVCLHARRRERVLWEPMGALISVAAFRVHLLVPFLKNSTALEALIRSELEAFFAFLLPRSLQEPLSRFFPEPTLCFVRLRVQIDRRLVPRVGLRMHCQVVLL